MTDCSKNGFEFQALKCRKVIADFNGGKISSDAGSLLLRELESHRGWVKDFAGCFSDHRNQRYVEHSVESLAAQRIFGLALGYEDLNDHDILRADSLIAVICGKEDPTGNDRRCSRDKGKPLAGKSTLNRLEHGKGRADRYKKIVCNEASIADLFVEKFISRKRRKPKKLIIDLDATDDPLHGRQEGSFFHGYYDCYCYLPLYIFCGSELLCAKLRPSDIDASKGSKEEVERIVKKLREKWPGVRIILRADSGFAREELMSWCEGNDVDYVFGLSRNTRLEERLKPAMQSVGRWKELTGIPARSFMELQYQTLSTWRCKRRVVGKAEITAQGENPRFIVTSLSAGEYGGMELYEDVYCARGEMENKIKEQQLDLFADRTSTSAMQANQIRLWLSSIAYCLLNDLRELCLKGTDMAKAQCGTIRLKLLKIGATISVSVRRILVRMASGYPWQSVFAGAAGNLLTLRLNTT